MTREERAPRSKAEMIIAKGKAAAIIIGAIGTAATAAWGAMRTHPEPGAKASYEVLKEAMTYERERREDLENEVATLKALIEYQYSRIDRNSLVKSAPSIVPLSPSAGPVFIPAPDKLKRPRSDSSAPKLPTADSLF